MLQRFHLFLRICFFPEYADSPEPSVQPRSIDTQKPGSALSHAINQQQSFGLARKCRRKKLEISISVEKIPQNKNIVGKKLMFEGHFPISLWLCKYEKNNHDL